MKKSLIALAALAAVGAASAQSSVTMYGRLDLGGAASKTELTNAGVTTTSKSTSLAGAEGSRTTSRLGIMGTEDLGGGLKANFNVETKINADNTSTVSTFGATRTAVVGLAGAFGSVALGTYKNSFDNVRGFTPTSTGTVGGDFLNKMHGDNTPFGVNVGIGDRSENSIAYRSPVFGGFQVSVGTTYEKTETTSPTVNTTTTTDGFIVGLGYKNGPINAFAALGQGKLETAALTGTTEGKVDDVAFAFSYSLGVAVPYLQIERSKLQNTGVPEVKAQSAEIGARFPMGALTPYISVGTGKFKFDGDEFKTSAVQVGALYDLSKRTQTYLSIGRDKNVEGSLLVNDEAKRTGFAVGVIHNF